MHKYIDKTWNKLMTEWLHPKLVCEICFSFQLHVMFEKKKKHNK